MITFSTRSHLVATLMSSVLLAVLGFQAASWRGALAGAVVGAVMAARMMLRGVAEPGASQAQAIMLTGPSANASSFRAKAIAPDIRALR